MEALLSSGSTMVMMLIIFALGYLARKLNMTDDDFDSKFSAIVMRIICPATVLDSVLGNTNLPNGEVVWQLLGVSFLSFVPPIVLGLLVARLYRIPENERGAHAFTVTFSNVGLVGFAICGAILGSNSILYLAIYNIPCNIVLFSVGAWMISRTGTVKLTRKEQLTYVRKNLISPIMVACVLALVLALLRVTDSGIIGSTCELLGAATAPAAMLIIGSTLAKYKVTSMLTNPWVYITTFMRLIVVPLVTYYVCGLFISDAYVLASLTLVTATPAAMMGITMSIMYGGDTKVLSQGMFLTTIFSVCTLPLIAMFVL